MTTATYAGQSIEVDEEGYLTNPAQWNRAIAEAIAKEAGLGALTDSHWKVIEFCRKDATEKGEAPGLRRIAKQSGVDMKTLYQLFPQGPGKLASKVSGLAKPKSCI